MTERMKSYRQRQAERGLVQIRVWVPEEDADFFKTLATSFQSMPVELPPIDRYGRKASQRQISLANSWAERTGLPKPVDLYDYHISLMGWISYARKVLNQKERKEARASFEAQMMRKFTTVSDQ